MVYKFMEGKEREEEEWGKCVAGVEKFPATLWNLDNLLMRLLDVL